MFSRKPHLKALRWGDDWCRTLVSLAGDDSWFWYDRGRIILLGNARLVTGAQKWPWKKFSFRYRSGKFDAALEKCRPEFSCSSKLNFTSVLSRKLELFQVISLSVSFLPELLLTYSSKLFPEASSVGHSAHSSFIRFQLVTCSSLCHLLHPKTSLTFMKVISFWLVASVQLFHEMISVPPSLRRLLLEFQRESSLLTAISSLHPPIKVIWKFYFWIYFSSPYFLSVLGVPHRTVKRRRAISILLIEGGATIRSFLLHRILFIWTSQKKTNLRKKYQPKR